MLGFCFFINWTDCGSNVPSAYTALAGPVQGSSFTAPFANPGSVSDTSLSPEQASASDLWLVLAQAPLLFSAAASK